MDVERRILESQTTLGVLVVIFSDLVGDQSLGLEGAIGLGEPRRDKKLFPLFGENRVDALPVGRGPLPDIDRNAENRPLRTYTSFPCALGGCWKCRPRVVRCRGEKQYCLGRRYGGGNRSPERTRKTIHVHRHGVRVGGQRRRGYSGLHCS